MRRGAMVVVEQPTQFGWAAFGYDRMGMDDYAALVFRYCNEA